MADFHVLADWMQTGIFHRYALPADPANLFGAQADNVRDEMGRQVVGAGGVLNGFENSGDALFRWGHTYLSWSTGTAATAYADIGYNGSAYDLGQQPAGNYTVALWARVSGAPTADTFRARLIRAGGTVLGSASPVTLTTTFTRFTITGALPALDNLYVRFDRASGTTNQTVLIAGVMIVAGSTAPDAFNAGPASRYDNLTAWTLRASAACGFQQAYRHVSDLGRATITLNNEAALFSPEMTTSPLYGALKAGRRLRIYADNDTVLSDMTLLWAGYTKTYKPSPFPGTLAECRIECVDLRGLAQGRTVRLPVLTDKRAYEIAQVVNAALDLPQEIIVVPVVLPPPPIGDPTPPVWEEVYPYALDAPTKDEADAVRILADCAGAMQGKIAYDARNPAYPFVWKYAHSLTAGASQITLDKANVNSAAYEYGGTLINECRVVARKRKLSTATDKILYDAEDTITLDPKETRRINARYKDTNLEDDKTVGGVGVYLEVTAEDGLTVTISEQFATGCEIMIVNALNAEKSVTALKVRGQKLTAWGETEHKATNTAALAEEGVRSELLDYRLPTDRKRAQRMAEYRVTRFGVPFGEFTSVTLKTLPGDDTLRSAMLNLGLFVNVTVSDPDRTGSAGKYTIIGTDYTLNAPRAGSDGVIGGFSVTWTLEKVYPFVILGDATYGRLDGTNYPVYT